MPHSIEYSDSGKNARISLDLDDVSLDSNLNEAAARYVTAKNVLVNHPGPVEHRGNIEHASATGGGILAFATAASVALFDGDKNAGSTYLPYVAFAENGSNNGAYFMQDDTGASASIITASADLPLPLGPSPTVDGNLLIAGPPASGSTLAGAPIVYMYGGSVMGATNYSTGTATFTTASDTVTGSGTTWTDDHVGAYIYNVGDSYDHWYRIVARNSNTEIILDKKFNGSDSGSGKSYVISACGVLEDPGGAAFIAPGGYVRAFSVFSAWGRAVVLNTSEDDATLVSRNHTRRMRWSGLVGSDIDGTAPESGLHYWHANAFWDFPAGGGDLISGLVHGDAVLVFQERQLNVMYGAPVGDGIGSLDASTVYTNTRLSQHGAAVSTPYGVFFVDSVQGVMLWDGSGPPVPVSEPVLDSLVSLAPTSIGYYNEHVFVSKLGGSSMYVLHVPTARWVEWTGQVGLTGFQAGRSDGAATHGDHYLIATDGEYVLNVSQAIDGPGEVGTDADLNTYALDLKTGSVGDWGVLLRPRRLHVTYRCEDHDAGTKPDPYLTVTVTTGMPDSQDAHHTEATEANRLPMTTGVETRVIELKGMSADPIIQVQVAQSNLALKVEVYNVVVDCDVEGQWESD